MTEQLPLDLRRELPLTQEPFIAHLGVADAAALIASWPNWPARVVALVGPEGSGKSHLAAIWAERAGAESAHSAEPLPPDIGPVLFEDADRTPADERLFHLINRAGQPGGALLLTARTPPSTWPTEVPDLRSRLNAIHVLDIAPPDEAGLLGLLRDAFRRRGVLPSEELLTFLSRRVERSALGARSIAERLDELALATGRPVSRTVARELLGRHPDMSEDD